MLHQFRKKLQREEERIAAMELELKNSNEENKQLNVQVGELVIP